MAEPVRTANLLLAALLDAGGASVIDLERLDDGRHVAVVDMAGFDRVKVGAALAEAGQAVLAGPLDWELWFERSFLDDVDHCYLKLKRFIGRRRQA